MIRATSAKSERTGAQARRITYRRWGMADRLIAPVRLLQPPISTKKVTKDRTRMAKPASFTMDTAGARGGAPTNPRLLSIRRWMPPDPKKGREDGMTRPADE